MEKTIYLEIESEFEKGIGRSITLEDKIYYFSKHVYACPDETDEMIKDIVSLSRKNRLRMITISLFLGYDSDFASRELISSYRIVNDRFLESNKNGFMGAGLKNNSYDFDGNNIDRSETLKPLLSKIDELNKRAFIMYIETIKNI